MPLSQPEAFHTALEVYNSKSILGEGGSGRVFLVHDSHGQAYAIKCLFPELVSTERLSRFKNELTFLRKNTHPNILSVIDDGYILVPDDKGNAKIPFYVMRLYPSTLRKLITDHLDPTRTFDLFQKLLDGVEAAHQRNIWHRDLKPENVLIDPSSWDLVIADFGIAHFSQEELYTAVQTQRAERLANFQYAAPEQRTRGRIVDQRADIYALGLILNEMFTGEIPFGTEFKRVANTMPALAYLDNVIDQMIRQSPNSRPSSINKVRLELSVEQQKNLNSIRVVGNRSGGVAKPSLDQINKADVDCIGRLEDTDHQTVLSISAGLSYSIMIPAVDKQKSLSHIGDVRPQWGRTRRCVFLYTILLYLLIKDHMKKLDMVVVDTEYPGYEPQIKNMLLQLLREMGLPVRKTQIQFERIDRNSSARNMASKVFKGKADPDSIIGVKQIIEFMEVKRSGPPK